MNRISTYVLLIIAALKTEDMRVQLYFKLSHYFFCFTGRRLILVLTPIQVQSFDFWDKSNLTCSTSGALRDILRQLVKCCFCSYLSCHNRRLQKFNSDILAPLLQRFEMLLDSMPSFNYHTSIKNSASKGKGKKEKFYYFFLFSLLLH